MEMTKRAIRLSILLLHGILLAAGPSQDPPRPEVSRFVDRLKTGDVDVRAKAASSLGALLPVAKEAVPDLIAAFSDKHPRVAFAASDALGQIGSFALPALTRTLGHEDVTVRRLAVRSIQRMGYKGKEAIPALIEALGDQDFDVRAEAGAALGGLRAHAAAAVDPLARLLDDNHPRVRAAAARSLGQIGKRLASVKPTLLRRRNDPDSRVRKEVRQTLHLLPPERAAEAPQAPRKDGGSDYAPGHWPQWRGPDRDNTSKETGLLKEWPGEGPALFWKAEGLGEGVGGISVAGGRIYALGYRDGKEFLTSLDGRGRRVWASEVGPAVKEMTSMRWLSQRTVTVDGERLYAVTARGTLLCLRRSDGTLMWTKDYPSEFGGVLNRWGGYFDAPLVDGNLLICTPGGPQGTIIALDKKSGERRWAASVKESKRSTHAAAIITTIRGKRQLIQQLDSGTVGVSPENGKLLWTARMRAEWNTNVHTAIPWTEGRVLTLCGWGRGSRLLTFDASGVPKVTEEEYKDRRFDSWFGNALRIDDHVYSFRPRIAECLDLSTGKAVWQERQTVIRRPVTLADGLIYARGMRGEVGLLKATPEGLTEISSFKLPAVNEATLTFPVVAGGRLYLRDQGDLYCYDVRGRDYREPLPDWVTRNHAPGHWPQWYGARRDNRSVETGLLNAWAVGGPKLLWKAKGVGEGAMSPSIAGGLIFIPGHQGRQEFVTALDGSGKVVWKQVIDQNAREYPYMRYLRRTAPTVDEKFLFTVTADGVLACLDTVTGHIRWLRNYRKDFGGSRAFYHSDNPIIDGNLVVCVPGGAATVVGLNKATGRLVWKSGRLKGTPSHAAMVPMSLGGARSYVVLTMESVSGVFARNGQILWSLPRRGRTVAVPTPVVHDGTVLVASGHGVGCSAFQISVYRNRIETAELYTGPQLTVQYGGMTLVGRHVYGIASNTIACMDFLTGDIVWRNRSVGQGSLLYADGHLIVRGERGEVALVEATPEGYREKGRFTPPDRGPERAYSHPVVAGGRLYLRDHDVLLCYDLRGTGYAETPPQWDLVARTRPLPVPARPVVPPARPETESDAVFVPTPQDVVDRMLSAAGVRSTDTVYDLGSGDGRIVLTAASRYRARAVGVEIEKELVDLSRAKIRKRELGHLVRIEHGDLFRRKLTDATVVATYLPDELLERLLPRLARLPRGCRIVSHQFRIPGFEPDATLTVTSKEDAEPHRVYVWALPLKPSLKPGQRQYSCENCGVGVAGWPGCVANCRVCRRSYTYR